MFDDETSAELPEHEEWIHNVAIPKLEKDWGVKTIIAQANTNYVKRFYTKKQKGKRIGEIYGFPIIGRPWCNDRLKVVPLKKAIDANQQYKEIIGITIDESKRMPKKRSNPQIILPLVDYNITQKQSFEIAKKANLLSPAYKNGIDRLGCWFCHNQKINELRMIKNMYPNLWSKLLKIDKDSPYTFKPNTTVNDLDKRFDLEDERLAQGLTINPHTKEFREALAKRLNK